MQTGGPMCRWEQAWWCCGRYHTGPQMGPCTVEPVAGAEAWALARWATLREAQPVRPKQADLITLGQDWSVVLQTHPHILHQGNRHYHDWLSQAGFILVCVCVFTCGFIPVLTGNIRLHVGFPCLSEKIVFSSQDNDISGQWFLPAFSQWANTPCASWCIIQPIFSDVFFKASSEYYL